MKITKYDYYKSAFGFMFLYAALSVYFKFKDETWIVALTLCFEAAIALLFYKTGLQNMKKNKELQVPVSTKLIVLTILMFLFFLISLYVVYVE